MQKVLNAYFFYSDELLTCPFLLLQRINLQSHTGNWSGIILNASLNIFRNYNIKPFGSYRFIDKIYTDIFFFKFQSNVSEFKRLDGLIFYIWAEKWWKNIIQKIINSVKQKLMISHRSEIWFHFFWKCQMPDIVFYGIVYAKNMSELVVIYTQNVARK